MSAWIAATMIQPGRFIMADVTGGLSTDIFGLDAAAVQNRVRQFARSWDVLEVRWNRGLFGIGADLKIYGRARAAVPAATVAGDVQGALNSFWSVAQSRVEVYESGNLQLPRETPRSEWAGAVSWVGAAVVFIGVVWLVREIRR